VTETVIAGRLAFRIDDTWWVASWAKPDTMDGAIELARIRMTLVRDNERLRTVFVDLIRAGADHMLNEAGLAPESWHRHQDPDHGRSHSGADTLE
jgi:hypothetical protein